jgi:hypothetical protein
LGSPPAAPPGTEIRKKTAFDLLLASSIGELELFIVFRELYPNRADTPAGFYHQWKSNVSP